MGGGARVDAVERGPVAGISQTLPRHLPTCNSQCPLHTLKLGHLGPTPLYIVGIDAKNGLLVSDGLHAISCHLGALAQRQVMRWVDEVGVTDAEEMVG